MNSKFRTFLVVTTLLATAGCNNDNLTLVATSPGGGTGGSGSGSGSGAAVGVTASTPGNASGALSSATSDSRSSNSSRPTPEALSTSSSTCDAASSTTPRGMSCLHCLHDNATEQSDELVDILGSTCIQNVAISYLVDGSFGSDYSKIVNHVETLASQGKTVFLHIYLLNGPSQRRYKNTPVPGLFTRVSPESFRRKIGTDDILRGKVRDLVWNLLPTLSEVASMGAVISLVPMLEDNLTEDSFNELADIIMEEIPADLPVSFGRNPCPTCYDGNDAVVPDGFFSERHSKSRDAVKLDGVYSNDGHDVSMNGQDLGSRVISLGALSKLRDTAESRNTLFLFWNAEYQGLKGEDGAVTGTGTDPDERTYAFPTRSERAKIIKFLNGN